MKLILLQNPFKNKRQNAERDLSIQYGQIIQQIEQYKKIIDFQQEKIKYRP